MAPRDIVIVGTGGSGRETLMVVRDIERDMPGSWRARGFLGADVPDQAILNRLGVPYLGKVSGVTERIRESAGWWFVSGIGSGRARLSTEVELMRQGLRLANLVHPAAVVGSDVEIGPGSVVCANSVITTNVRIGRSAQINIGCIIAHDAQIGDHVTFAQSVNLCGAVTVADHATIFTGAKVLPGLTIGAHAVVGAGAVVCRDVPARITVAGVPARPLD